MFARRCGVSLLRDSLASLSTLPSSSATILPRAAAFSRTFATEVSIPKSEAGDKVVVGLFKTKKPGRPLRDLTAPLRRKGGRNGHGRITIRFRGGGHKQRIRLVDFFRNEPGACDVVRIEYDPGRSAHIALIKNRNPKVKQAYSYIIAPEGLRAGQIVESFRQGIPEGLVPGFVDSKDVRGSQLEAPKEEGASQTTSTESLALGMLRSLTLRPGNVLPLRLIPTGTVVHNVTLKPEGRALLVRSAGTFAQVIEHERGGKYSHVRLQSGEVRKVLQDCVATIGKVSNANWQSRSLGKAGRSRWLGRRPHVRGMAMNRCDHPHGGGRGKSKGNEDPRSVWGWLTKGKRTRKPGPKGPKNSNKFVVRERPRGKEKKVLSS